ncbi:MAG: hypothetical protein AAB065_08465, partial [Deltaproteobacteria bacterium]
KRNPTYCLTSPNPSLVRRGVSLSSPLQGEVGWGKKESRELDNELKGKVIPGIIERGRKYSKSCRQGCATN